MEIFAAKIGSYVFQLCVNIFLLPQLHRQCLLQRSRLTLALLQHFRRLVGLLLRFLKQHLRSVILDFQFLPLNLELFDFLLGFTVLGVKLGRL